MSTPYLDSFDFDVLRAEQWVDGRPPFTHEWAMRLPSKGRLKESLQGVQLGEQGSSGSRGLAGIASDAASSLRDAFFIRAEMQEADLKLLEHETQEYRKSLLKSEIVDNVSQGQLTLTLQESGSQSVLKYLKLWNNLIWNGAGTDPEIRGTVNPPQTYWMDAHLDLLRFQVPYVDSPVPMWLADLKLINIFPKQIGELDLQYSDPDIHNYTVEFSVQDVQIDFKSALEGDDPAAPSSLGQDVSQLGSRVMDTAEDAVQSLI